MNAISFLVMLAALAIILIAVYISNNNYSRRQSTAFHRLRHHISSRHISISLTTTATLLAHL